MNWFSLSTASSQLLTHIFDDSVRALILAILAAVFVPFLRRKSAAQHAMWTLVLLGMLAMPVLRLTVPAAYVRVRDWPAPRATLIQYLPAPANPSPMPIPPLVVLSEPAPIGWKVCLAAAYMLGLLLFSCRLLAGLVFAVRIQRGSRVIDPEKGVAESNRVRVPITIGFKRGRVILPLEWRDWPSSKLNVVLAHELAHLHRRDPLIALAAAINKCVFWFHPLAWWLERRLAVLAEYVADDAGLEASINSQIYARTVLEIASGLETGKGRLIWYTPSMSGPLVARRIRRIMDPGLRGRALSRFACVMLLSSAAPLLWISTAVEIQNIAQAQSILPPHAGFLAGAPAPDLTAVEQAAAMEQQLAVNPEDEAIRAKLLHYYGSHKLQAQRAALVLWLIDHHPESTLHAHLDAAIFASGPNSPGSATFEDARARWLTQVQLHPADPQVLANASNALFGANLQEGLDLMKRAQKLAPARWTQALAGLYTEVLVWSTDTGRIRTGVKNPLAAAQFRRELLYSEDATLVGAVARHVVENATRQEFSHNDFDLAALRTIAAELVLRAESLEPHNQQWTDLMEGVKALPAFSSQPAVTSTSKPQVVRIGPAVAAYRLQESAAPAYPPEAKAAGVEGSVKLEVRIGTDGRVMDVTLISGHPLLTPAAIEAVQHYVYQPVMLGDNPIEVLTTVEVAFGAGRKY